MGKILDAFLDWTLLGYTKAGYRARHLAPWLDGSVVSGRNVLVTGATGGLGEATAARLAALGANVTLVGRSDAKLEATVRRIRGATPNAVLRVEKADLSSMVEVAALADRLLSRGEPLHVLVNCVGVLLNRRELTREGVETTFATNLLGHFLLTERIHPLLVKGAPSRIINVSSGGMYTQRIRPDDLETERIPYDGPTAYARTKRGQVILSELWAERWARDGIVVHSMHPGWADTQGVRDSLPTFRRITAASLRNADEGADTIVWLAASAEGGRESGRFWHDRRAWPTHRMERTRETQAERRALVSALDGRLARLLPSH